MKMDYLTPLKFMVRNNLNLFFRLEYSYKCTEHKIVLEAEW